MGPYNSEEIRVLAQKWFEGTITEDEKIVFDNWYNQHDLTQYDFSENYTSDATDLKENIRKRLKKDIPEFNKGTFSLSTGFLYAAASVAVVFVTLIFLFRKEISKTEEKHSAQMVSNDIKPGSAKALLTLSGGKKILLQDRAMDFDQNGVRISNNAEGTLAYSKSSSASSVINFLETPRGGEYHLVLPDGTGVWLNSASSLTYPTAFNGDERIVDLRGEAYFEVAKVKSNNGKRVPFKVRLDNGYYIDVLGTHFNIMAYADEEQLKTSLFEGAVRFYSKTSKNLLEPGQTAAVNVKEGGRITVVESENTEKILAWKNHFFVFDGDDLRTVMRQLSRWYDVTVEYEAGVPNDHHHGSISREMPLSQVLKVLRLSGVDFRVEGKKIIVRK